MPRHFIEVNESNIVFEHKQNVLAKISPFPRKVPPQYVPVNYKFFFGQIVAHQWRESNDPDDNSLFMCAAIFLGVLKPREAHPNTLPIVTAVILDNMHGLRHVKMSSLSHFPSGNLYKEWFTNATERHLITEQRKALEIFWGYLVVSGRYRTMPMDDHVWDRFPEEKHMKTVAERLELPFEVVERTLDNVNIDERPTYPWTLAKKHIITSESADTVLLPKIVALQAYWKWIPPFTQPEDDGNMESDDEDAVPEASGAGDDELRVTEMEIIDENGDPRTVVVIGTPPLVPTQPVQTGSTGCFCPSTPAQNTIKTQEPPESALENAGPPPPPPVIESDRVFVSPAGQVGPPKSTVEDVPMTPGMFELFAADNMEKVHDENNVSQANDDPQNDAVIDFLHSPQPFERPGRSKGGKKRRTHRLPYGDYEPPVRKTRSKGAPEYDTAGLPMFNDMLMP